MIELFSNSNPDFRYAHSELKFCDIDMKIYFLVNLSFAQCESDVRCKNLLRNFLSRTWKLQRSY